MNANKRFPLQFTNDPSLGGVLAELESGREAVVQFSAPIFEDSTLDKLNAWAARFGRALQIRFFGLGMATFDCAVLRRLANVAHLDVDSVSQVTNIEAMQDLPCLQALRIGIQQGVPDDFLQAPMFHGLKSLILSGDERKKLDLAPVRHMPQLEFLHVTGHTRGLEALAGHESLQGLSLSAIGRAQSIAFVSSLPGLRSLSLILGGRSDLDEIAAPSVDRLDITRVQGLERLDLSSFPNLRDLDVSDQPRLTELRIAPAHGLATLGIGNCPALVTLEGLRSMPALVDLHVNRTGLDFDALVADGLPPALKSLWFYTRTTREDRVIAQKLGTLGFAVD